MEEQQIEPHNLIQEDVRLGKFPYLDVIAKRWGYLLEATLFEQLGAIFKVEADLVYSTRFQEFSQEILPQQAIYVFQIGKLPGNSLLLVDNKFAHACISEDPQVLLQDQPDAIPELNPDNQSKMLNILKFIVHDFENSWEGIGDVSLQLKRIVTHRFRAKVIPPFEKCLILRVSMSSYGFNSTLCLCIPFLNLDSILQKLPRRQLLPPETTDHYYQRIQDHFADALGNASYEVTAELGSIQVTSSQGKFCLKEGDIFPIQSDVGKKLTLRVEDKACFTGEIGATENNFAVKVMTSYETERADFRQRMRAFKPIQWPSKF